MPITDPAPAGSGIDPNRRDFVRAAVGTGFAAAGSPFATEAARTDNAGRTPGEVAFKAGDANWPASRAMRAKRLASVGALPAEQFNPWVFGVRKHMADAAPRCARLGHLAVAPEWFCAGAIRSRTARSPSGSPRSSACGPMRRARLTSTPACPPGRLPAQPSLGSSTERPAARRGVVQGEWRRTSTPRACRLPERAALNP
ncbi:MAG: hypothetical protein H7306_22910 [Bacteriovorax sp.]|nr:hypothetical protein [Rhizobacter sp.]